MNSKLSSNNEDSTNTVNIDLGGGKSYLAPLYSLAESSTAQAVESVINDWFTQTLRRDGFDSLKHTVSVTDTNGTITLTTPSGETLPARVLEYACVVPKFLAIGADAWNNIVPELKSSGQWDPNHTGKWHFFMPHGLPMLSQRSLQFFHYPPVRLLEQQDYLHDPVPYRWGQLLEMLGVNSSIVPLYERVIDGAPIAAPDDQGTLIPIETFTQYQIAMVKLMLEKVTMPGATFTPPIVVFGIPAMARFEKLFGVNLDILVPMVASNIIEGTKTPVLGATHPYHFYAQAQIDRQRGLGIGDGRMGQGCQLANMLMKQDIIAAMWQQLLAADPSLDVGDALFEATAYALHPKLNATACALTRHQGSLWYPDPNSLNFSFKIDYDSAITYCRQDPNPCA